MSRGRLRERLALSVGTRLEKDLREDTSGKHTHLIGWPKGLLPFCGRALLDIWWSVINRRELFDDGEPPAAPRPAQARQEGGHCCGRG